MTFLVPLDGSQLSENALVWAKRLAENHNDLHLIRCVSPVAQTYFFSDKDFPNPLSGSLTNLLTRCEEYLDEIVDSQGLSGAHRTVVEGKPAASILNLSQADDVVAIVMSSHGAGGLESWTIGSVAAKVVRGSTKPVFIVRADRSASSSGLNKILLCLDGSSLAEKGLDWSVRLAQRFRCELKLLRIVDHHSHEPAQLQKATDEASGYLKDVASRVPVKTETAVRVGGILEGVLKESDGLDLTVVTSHGLGGIKRRILGSLTEKILQGGRTDLLVVPA
jgi:nucleotide-binding universal stress UspA family protein